MNIGEIRRWLQITGTPVQPLWLMWTHPRMIVFFLGVAALGLLARLPFAFVHILPSYISFQPEVVLVPVAAVLWGPAGIWGCVAAGLLGDRWFGLDLALSMYRGLGILFFGLNMQVLGHGVLGGDSTDFAAGLGRSLQFLLAALPGGVLAAAWMAIGSEILRIYPFSYVVSLLILNHTLFIILFGLPLLNLARWQIVRRFGTWQEVMSVEPGAYSRGVLSRTLMLAGGLGACAIGLYISHAVYRISLIQPFMLGSTSGRWVSWTVWPFLLLNIYGLFRREK
ncbi:MAG TPA: hypothetical protein DCZ95_19025 [Verrucomicrobia bacterium]|nr:hypothetical protein [Verrucomicrobiota bacterium]